VDLDVDGAAGIEADVGEVAEGVVLDKGDAVIWHSVLPFAVIRKDAP
jgi:hypothetical protein